MDKRPLNDQEIIEMLAKLREETSEYPPELMKSRKATFIKRVAEMKDAGANQSGSDRYQGGAGGQSGWGGGALSAAGTGAATTESSTNTAIIIGIVIVLLTVAYLFRNQIVELLVENEIINVEETATPAVESLLLESATETPAPQAFGALPSETRTAKPASGFGADNKEGVPVTGSGSGSSGSDGGQGVGPSLSTPTPLPGLSQNLPTPTSSPPKGLIGRLRFLVCILRSGAENCE
jgi:hypothetical protein